MSLEVELYEKASLLSNQVEGVFSGMVEIKGVLLKMARNQERLINILEVIDGKLPKTQISALKRILEKGG